MVTPNTGGEHRREMSVLYFGIKLRSVREQENLYNSANWAG